MTLRLKNVSRVVQSEYHLKDVNIAFRPGSFNVLLGRTLAGKTSLMRIIAGLDQPTSGKLLMDDVDVTGVPVQQRKVSMVYQQFINYPNMNVFENIASPLRILGEAESVIKSKVEAIAELLHIEDFLQRMPLELSGGQQQRTAMARALVKDSQLILFDEPLVNLDYKLREELRFELRELFKQRNTIAIYASTEPNEALALGGVTTLMHQGRVIQSGPVNEVYRQPSQIEAAELFSEPPINILDGVVNDSSVVLSNGIKFTLAHLGKLADGPYRFGLRPHHISLTAESADDIAVDLQVDVAEISGSETYLHMSTDSLSLVAQVSGVHHFHTDTSIRVYFPASKLYVFDQQGKTVCMPNGQMTDKAATVDEQNETVFND